jgi:phosphatidylglycerophosphatase A
MTISADEHDAPSAVLPARLMGVRPARRVPVPSWAFMLPRLSRWIALGFGSGLVVVAPGTFGTLWAWAVFVLLDPWISDWVWAVLWPASWLLGCWACGRTGAALGVPDHSAMVWDEVVAFWGVLLLVPGGWLAQAMAFVLFRFFDVFKPPPIGVVDRALKGGLGVMLDDLIAAFYTVLLFALWHAVG